MKLLLCFIFFFMPLANIKYVVQDCEQNKLSIEIGEIYKYKTEVTQGGYQDLFTIMHPDSSVKYLINIIRAKSPITSYEYLKSDEYKSSFSTTTSSIEEVKEVNYATFKGIRFLKRITSPQRVFLSYSISTIIQGDLFVITYNTIESNFAKYESEFDHSINSIRFK
ncbi:MAG: hypothetical protein H7331_05735 [Bacteroidia bacterium]|nr:hypothetical protein [Bacteroidia bacterium]